MTSLNDESGETICPACGLPLTDRDEEGPLRADCAALRSAWCTEWTEKREAAAYARALMPESDESVQAALDATREQLCEPSPTELQHRKEADDA